MATINDAETLETTVREAVADATVTDVHTHLFPPSHEGLLLWGVDELLTYHYLVAEMFAMAPRDLTPERFWKLSKREQADLVWKHVFQDHGALSEAARGAINTLTKLGFDLSKRDLRPIREWFDRQDAGEYLDKVFEMAGIDYAIMTNDPFKSEEVARWQADRPVPDKLRTALRMDPLLVDWSSAVETMNAQGYDVSLRPDDDTYAQARKFLADWADRLEPVYMAASLPPDFHYPSDQPAARALANVVLPVAQERNLPVAMMIGVRKRVHPALRDAGDSVGIADVTAVQNLCAENPDVKFLVTMLSRVNQHELCVCARKFGNLHIFGCWWFCNDPSIIDEITRMRLELLGPNFTANHSDARVLDQLIYKWDHTKQVVADVLADKYRLQLGAGWRPTEEEVQRSARYLFGGMFEEFLAK